MSILISTIYIIGLFFFLISGYIYNSKTTKNNKQLQLTTWELTMICISWPIGIIICICSYITFYLYPLIFRL